MKTRGTSISKKLQREVEEIEKMLNVEITLTEDDPIIKSLDNNKATEIMAQRLVTKVMQDFLFEQLTNRGAKVFFTHDEEFYDGDL